MQLDKLNLKIAWLDKSLHDYQPLGENLEQQLLESCKLGHSAYIGQVISRAMQADPKLTLSGFEQFFRTQENNPASRIFILSAPAASTSPEIQCCDFRDFSVLKSRYIWICLYGPLEALEYMEAFGIEDQVHNLKLLDTETGILVQKPS